MAFQVSIRSVFDESFNDSQVSVKNRYVKDRILLLVLPIEKSLDTIFSVLRTKSFDEAHKGIFIDRLGFRRQQ